jgi:hypothetical protein
MVINEIVAGKPAACCLCVSWTPAGALSGIFEVYSDFPEKMDPLNYTISAEQSKLIFPSADRAKEKDGVENLYSILESFRQPELRTLLASSSIAESVRVPF